MPEPTRGMGRGLAAILSASPSAGDDPGLRTIPLSDIGPNPHQPRTSIGEESIATLAASLTERGVLQPVIVRPVGGAYELIAGERRWRAAAAAGLTEIPAIVRKEDDAASLELALIENMAREDLNPVDEARACAALVEELGLTREAVGRRVGRSRVAVSNLIRLLDLPDDTLVLIESGALSEGHGRALLLTEDHDRRRALARSAAEQEWSVRELERRAREETVAVVAHARAKRTPHPDEEAALTRLSDAFGAMVGTEAKVTTKGEGCQVQLAFESFEAAQEAVRRLGGRAAA